MASIVPWRERFLRALSGHSDCRPELPMGPSTLASSRGPRRIYHARDRRGHNVLDPDSGMGVASQRHLGVLAYLAVWVGGWSKE